MKFRESQLGQKLGESEIDKVTAFLKSLSRQPEVVFPILPPSVASTPPSQT